MKKDAQIKGGHGRGLQNRMSKTVKRNIDRKVDKRRRREGKVINKCSDCGQSNCCCQGGGYSGDAENYCGGY